MEEHQGKLEEALNDSAIDQTVFGRRKTQKRKRRETAAGKDAMAINEANRG